MNIQFMNNHEIAEEIKTARTAQTLWESTPLVERLRKVKLFRHLLVEHKHKISQALFLDSGKPLEECLGAELLPLAEACKFLERNAIKILKERKVLGRDTPLWMFFQKSVVHRKARGIIGILGTWNYPLVLNGVQIIQALVAGNAVCWKPSENAIETSKVLVELLLSAGFSSALLKILSPTRENGPLLIEANIDFLIMTGSVTTGKAVAKKLAEKLIPSTLELSGIDSLILLEDGNIDLAVRAAWFASNLNAGQTCMASRRFFVPETLVAKVEEKLVELAQEYKPRKILLESQANAVLPFIDNALNNGAKLLWPNNRSKIFSASFFDSCIVSNVNNQMQLCQEAIFAPVLTVISYKTLNEAIQLSNDSAFGLCASLFTANIKLGKEIALQLKVGSVAINDVIIPHAHPATPFGGIGLSGWGVTQGEEGLLEMTRPLTVSTVSGGFRPHYDLPTPKAANSIPVLEGMLEALHSGSFIGKIRGWLKIVTSGKSKK